MNNEKCERNQQLVKMAREMTQKELSEAFEISQERVVQILKKHNTRAISALGARSRVLIGKLGTMADFALAKKYGFAVSHVRYMRQNLGIPKYKVCRCKTKIYALGMCRPCYARYTRNKKNGHN